MGSINDSEEDRISDMPKDIIRHMLSFLDTKYAVQFCTLSHKWKDIWTSIRHLNFSNDSFSSIRKFDKFMEDALSHRDNQTEVFAVKLKFTGLKILDAVIDTIEYADLHNVKQLTLECGKVYELPPCLFSSPTLKHLSLSSTYTKSRVIDSAWNMPALETLYLSGIRLGDIGDMRFNLFHECVKLTSLTLENCSMFDLETFYVCAPNLLNLTITRTTTFPKVFHVFAPRLETFTTGGYSTLYQFLKLSTEEGFSSLEKVNLSLSRNLQKSERHVPSLLDLFKKVSSAKSLILDVNITEVTKLAVEEKKTENLAEEKRMLEAKLQKQNQQIPYQAKLKMLNLQDPCHNVVFGAKPQMHDQLIAKKKKMFEAQWRTQDQPVSNTNATFELHNVFNKSHAHAAELHGAPRPPSGNINMAPLKQRDCIPTFPIQVGNCSLENSLNATFVMDSLLQVPQKRSRQQRPDDTMANKVPKLDVEKVQPETMADENRILKEKLQKQEQLMAKEKAMLMENIQMKEQLIATLGAQNLQHEKLISHIFKCKIAELKVQVKSGCPNYGIIRSMSGEIKSVMDLIHGSLRAGMEAQFSSQYEEAKSLSFEQIDATHWAMIETELGLVSHFGRIRFNDINSQSHVRATELP